MLIMFYARGSLAARQESAFGTDWSPEPTELVQCVRRKSLQNAMCQVAATSRPVTIFFFWYCKQQQSSRAAWVTSVTIFDLYFLFLMFQSTGNRCITPFAVVLFFAKNAVTALFASFMQCEDPPLRVGYQAVANRKSVSTPCWHAFSIHYPTTNTHSGYAQTLYSFLRWNC